MPITDDIARLSQDLELIKAETRANAQQIAGAIRKTRLNLAVVQHDAAVRALRQPTALLDWHPRPGTPTDPAVQNSLIDRLRRGNPVADSLGNVNTFLGFGNLLADPVWDQISSAPPALTASDVVFGKSLDIAAAEAWYAKGSLSYAASTYQRTAGRESRGSNPFASSVVTENYVGLGAGTHMQQLRSASVLIGTPHEAVFIVGAVRVYLDQVPTNTNWTTLTLTVEVYDATSGVVRGTRTLNMLPLALGDNVQVWCAFNAAGLTKSWQLRIRMDGVSTGNASLLWQLGEPYLGFSLSPDPPPYTPQVGAYFPNAVTRALGSSLDGERVLSTRWEASTFPVFEIVNDGTHLWGTGLAAADVRMWRDSVGPALVVDRAGGAGPARLRLESPNDALFGVYKAGDVQPQALLYASGTTGVVGWGPGGATAVDVVLQRTGAKAMQMDDNAGGGITTMNFKTTNLQQNGVAVSLVGHGAADHADLTRRLWLPYEVGTVDGAAAGVIGASPNVTRCAVLADAATQGLYWVFEVPADYASGLAYEIVWAPAATDGTAHTVRWSRTEKAVAAGTTLSAAGTTTAWTGASAARTAAVAVFEPVQATGVAPVAGFPVTIILQRIGADAADTYVGAVNLIGIIVSYTANQ